MRCQKAIPLALAVFGPISALAAQDIVPVLPILSEGDTVIGMGAVERVTLVAINDSRMWIAQVETSFDDFDQDGCLLRNGFVTMREGMQLFAPPAQTLDDWTSVALDNNGNLGMLITMPGLLTGCFWNSLPLIVVNDPVSDPLVPLIAPGTTMATMSAVKMNSNGVLLLQGEVENPGVPSPSAVKEDTLMRFQVDSQGNVLSRR